MPWTACPVHRIGTLHVFQKLQSDQGSTSSPTSQHCTGGKRSSNTVQLFASSPQPPISAPPPRPCRQEGALKLSAAGFTSSDRFLKQQQHKVLVWLAGNLKLSRQSSPLPRPLRLPRAPARRDRRSARPQGSPTSASFPRRRRRLRGPGAKCGGRSSWERKPTNDSWGEGWCCKER